MEKNTCSKNNGKELQFNCAQYREAGGPEGSTYMPSRDCEPEMELYGQATDKQDFIFFLRFCSERLNRGETVRAIWHDYLATVAEKLK